MFCQILTLKILQDIDWLLFTDEGEGSDTNGKDSDSELQDDMDDEANKMAADEAKKDGLVSFCRFKKNKIV